MALAKLLVVDSSAEDRLSISRQLHAAGHDAVCAADATEALALLQASRFDAVITEWLLTDASGLDLAARVRRTPHGAGARVLVTSSHDRPVDVAVALNSGIDDFVIKPPRPEELVARVNAALRRPPSSDRDILQVGSVVLDRRSHKVTASGHEVDLAPLEFRLLAYLIENRGRVLGRKQLLVQVWHRRKGIGERTVDVHVRRLRAALAPYKCDDLLQTVRGFGYRFG